MSIANWVASIGREVTGRLLSESRGRCACRPAIVEAVERRMLLSGAPTIGDTAFVINYRSLRGTPVGNINASGPLGDQLTYDLTGVAGTNLAAFQIDSTGLITVANNSLLPVLKSGHATVIGTFDATVTDTTSSMSTTDLITVTLSTIQQVSPVFGMTSQVFNHTPAAAPTGSSVTTIGTVAASLAYSGQRIGYSLTGTNASMFDINANGVISTTHALAPLGNAYFFNVVATDGSSGPSATVPVEVDLTLPQIVTTTSSLSVTDASSGSKPLVGATISDLVKNAPLTVVVTMDRSVGLLTVGGSGFVAGTGAQAGTYTLSGVTGAAATTDIRELTFIPIAHIVKPGGTYHAPISVTVTDNDNAMAVGGVATASPLCVVTVTGAIVTPSISGNSLTSPSIMETQTAAPFSSISVHDNGLDAFDNVTLSVDNSAKGNLAENSMYTGPVSFTPVGGMTGRYFAAGTPAQVTAAIDALVFTPNLHVVAPTYTFTTHFTIYVSNGLATAIDSVPKVYVTTSADTPPILNGVVASFSTTDIVPIKPFNGVTVTDPDSGNTTLPAGKPYGQTETVTITLSDTTLGKLGGNRVVPSPRFPNTYTITGSVATVNNSLATLEFIPKIITSNSPGNEVLSINVNDGIVETANQTTTITISDLTALYATIVSSNLNSPVSAGTAVVNLSASTHDALTYSLVGPGSGTSASNALFTIGGTSDNQLVVAPSTTLLVGPYYVLVQAQDAGGDTVTQALKISIGTANSNVKLNGVAATQVG